jgi:diacylglycerol kinase family enzyme
MLYAAMWYRPATMQVTIDGDRFDGQQVVISSIRNYAGYFSIADRAICDDGLMDVVIFPRAGVPRMTLALISALRKRVSRRGDVIYRTGRHIEVTCESGVHVQVDGDAAGRTPLEITTHHRAVQFLAPPEP